MARVHVVRGWLASAALTLLLVGCGGKSSEAPGGSVHVAVGYPGADPAVVERELVIPLERALTTVPRVVGLRASARADGAIIEVRFARGVERDAARLAVSEALQAARATLPPGADVPMLTAGRPASWVYATVAAADAERARHETRTVAGVLLAETCGEPRLTAAIELDPDQLAARGVTAAEVLDALSHENLALPGGSIDTYGSTLTVGVRGSSSTLEELVATVVGGREVPVRLEDVGRVSLVDRPACRVGGTRGAALLRVGLRGTGDDLIRARREVERRLRDLGATLVARPMTVGTIDDIGALFELDMLAASFEGAHVIVPVGSRGVIVLWPGRDPDTARTAREVVADTPDVALLGRWALRDRPLLEGTLRGDDADALLGQAQAAVGALMGGSSTNTAGGAPCGVDSVPRIELDRARMAALGVSAADVAEALRWGQPRPVGTLRTGSQMIDITLALAHDLGWAGWEQLPVASRDGAVVRLADIASVSTDARPGELLRIDGRRAITVWAQGAPGSSTRAVRAALARALPGATIAPADLRALEAEPWSGR